MVLLSGAGRPLLKSRKQNKPLKSFFKDDGQTFKVVVIHFTFPGKLIFMNIKMLKVLFTYYVMLITNLCMSRMSEGSHGHFFQKIKMYVTHVTWVTCVTRVQKSKPFICHACHAFHACHICHPCHGDLTDIFFRKSKWMSHISRGSHG